MGLCPGIFVRSTEKVTNPPPPHSRSKFLSNMLRYDRKREELELKGKTEHHPAWNGSGRKGNLVWSTACHRPFFPWQSRIPFSPHLIYLISRTDFGSMRQTHNTPLSLSFTNHNVENEIEIRPFPAVGGVGAGSIHYWESVQPRYAFVSLKTWSGHGRETVVILYVHFGSAGRVNGEITGTRYGICICREP